MKRIPNNDDLFNMFKSTFENVMSISEDTSIVTVVNKIQQQFFSLGIEFFELWIYKNIGTGYKGTKISKEISNEKNEKILIDLKFNGYKKRNTPVLSEK